MKRDTDLKDKDSCERTDGDKMTVQEIWEVWHKAGVSEPGSEYRIAQPGSHALLLQGEAPGGPPEQSCSWEMKQEAISVQVAVLLCPSNAHLGSGQGVGPGKKKML
jgi:hypothetical protein